VLEAKLKIYVTGSRSKGKICCTRSMIWAWGEHVKGTARFPPRPREGGGLDTWRLREGRTFWRTSQERAWGLLFRGDDPISLRRQEGTRINPEWQVVCSGKENYWVKISGVWLTMWQGVARSWGWGYINFPLKVIVVHSWWLIKPGTSCFTSISPAWTNCLLDPI